MKSIILDDGIEYLIFDTETINDIEYTLFVNINDDKDICFRKTIIENDEKFYIGLDDEKEFEKVLLSFTKKFIE
jgi:hypothetical protein